MKSLFELTIIREANLPQWGQENHFETENLPFQLTSISHLFLIF